MADCAEITRFLGKYINYVNTFINANDSHIAYIPQGFCNAEMMKAYSDNLEFLKKTLEINTQRIATKVSKPSEIIELDSLKPYLEALNQLIKETNDLFNKNNEIVEKQEYTQKVCLNKVFELMSFELQGVIKAYYERIESLKTEIPTLQKQVGEHKSKIAIADGEIAKIAEKLGGTGIAVERINLELQKSGFTGFSLLERSVQTEHGEKIVYVVEYEKGKIAHFLSEGEKNFIAILYFYFLVQGAFENDDLTKKKVVVIDDPVSSMDSGVLFIVGSLIRRLVDDCFCDGKDYNIRQIFVLTHNPFFHKDVSFYRLGNENFKKVSFFEVRKTETNISNVISCVREIESSDPDITHENYTPVQDPYTALWYEYRENKLPATLLSIMNRIAGHHLVQVCNFTVAELRRKVEDQIKDPVRLRMTEEILRYVYNGSNVIDMGGMFFAANKDDNDYREVFKEIFIAVGQEQHYNRMAGEKMSEHRQRSFEVIL
jgi:wobble nucleotide-excising tRNase